MKRENLLDLISILSVGYNEILIDITISDVTINSIEIDGDDILCHTFNGEFDTFLYYDDLSDSDQKIIQMTLSVLLYN